METMNELELGKACDLICERTNNHVCNGIHGGFWLYNKLRDYFCGETAAVSVEIPCVYFDYYVGTATIHRNGKLECRLSHDVPTGKENGGADRYWIVNRDTGAEMSFDTYVEVRQWIMTLKDIYVVKVYGYNSRYVEFWKPGENEKPRVIMP